VDGLRWEKPYLPIFDPWQHLFTPSGMIDFQKAEAEHFFTAEKVISIHSTGAEWTLPRLPLNHSRRSNVIWSGGMGRRPGAAHFGQNGNPVTVVLDPTTNDKTHRYMALHECRKPKGYQWTTGELCMSVSSDGLHFQPALDGRSVAAPASDTWNKIILDPVKGRYLLYTRSEFGTADGWREIRGHRTMSSRKAHAPTADWKLEKEWFFDREGFAEKDRRHIYSLRL